MDERVRVIVALGIRRGRILESPELDLKALAVLAADYEVAEMPCAAENVRNRVEYYQDEQRLYPTWLLRKKCWLSSNQNCAYLNNERISLLR